MLLLIATLLLYVHVQCGHIHRGPYTLTHPIATKCNKFQFIFALDTGIDLDEYLKVAFPFPLHGSNGAADIFAVLTKPFVPWEGQSTIWDVQQIATSGTLDSMEIGNSTTSTISDNIYSFNFKVPLLKSTWYMLTITTLYTTAQTAGYKNPVRMLTTSSLDANAVIYDENPSIYAIALGSMPADTLSLNATYSVASPGASQEVQLSIRPTVSIGQPHTFLIELETDYKFTAVNDSVTCTTSDCECTLNQGALKLACISDMLNKNITISTRVSNSPTLKSTATAILVYSYYGNQFLEYARKSDQFKLVKLTLTVNLFMMWGVPYDTDLATLYKPISATPAGYPYNNVKVQFKLTTPTPKSELLVTISLGDAQALLEGSIAHNLGVGVVCYYNTLLLICKRIAQLTETQTYFISFKCAFKSTAINPQTNFGRVTIKSVIRNTNSYDAYVLAGPTGQNVVIQSSSEYTDTARQGVANFGYNYVTGAATTGTFASAYSMVNGMTVGLKVGVQRLLFNVQVLPAQMCPASKSYCAAGKFPELFMKTLFNKNAIKVDNSTTLFEMSSACSASICSTQFNKYGNDTYSLLKCSKSYDTCSVLFNGGKGFGFVGEVLFHTSIYPSERTLDFVVAFYEGSTGSQESSATLVTAQLMQAYTLSETRTVKGSFVNYYATSTQINAGDVMPAMLRLLGSIATPGSHVGIFVDAAVDQFFANSLSQIQKDDDAGTKTTQILKCSAGCTWYTGAGVGATTVPSYYDAYMNQRILITDLQGTFDALFAFKNTPNNLPQSLVVASMNFNLDNNAYDIVQPVRIFGAAWQITNILTSPSYYSAFLIALSVGSWDGISNWNSHLAGGNVIGKYKVQDPTLLKTGDSITLNIMSEHTDGGSVVQQNNGMLWGAGFTVSGITTLVNPTWTGGNCIQLSTLMYCPYDLAAYVSNAVGNKLSGTFPIPSTWGASSSIPFKYAFSNNKGNMVAFMNEVQTMSATAMKSGCVATDWWPIAKASKRQQVQFSVTPLLEYTLSIGGQLNIRLDVSQMTSGLSLISLCSVSVPSVTCALGGSGKIVTFTMTATAALTIPTGTEIIVKFYVTHTGVDIDEQSFSVSLLVSGKTVESCPKSNQIRYLNYSLEKTLIVNNFKLQNNNKNTKSGLTVDFALNNRTLLVSTRFTMQLGFMSPTNSLMFSSQSARCQFYEAGIISRHWKYINFVATTKSLQFKLKDNNMNSTSTYTLQCSGIRNPDESLTDPITISWTDEASNDQAIQSNTISYNTLKLLLELPYLKPITLFKYLNTPGFGSYYEFTITPTRTNLTYHGKMYIEFSQSMQVIQSNLQCFLNLVDIDCYTHPTVPRRIVLIPQKSAITRLMPNVAYNFTIGPIVQPKNIDSYGKIWVCADLDNNEQNGYQEFSFISEIPVQSTLPSLIPSVAIAFTQYNTRTAKVYLRVNITAPIRAINTDKVLVIELSESFARPLKRNTQAIECRLYRVGDINKYNYTDTCQLRFNRLLTIQLKYDTSNSRQIAQYQLEVRSLYTPDWVDVNPLRVLFNEQVKVYFTDTSLANVQYVAPPALQYTPDPLIFRPTAQAQFNWYSYNSELETFNKLEPLVGFTQYPVFTIQKGVLNKLQLFLGLDTESRFGHRIELSIDSADLHVYGKNSKLIDYSIYNDHKEYPLVVDSNPDSNQAISNYQIDALMNSTQQLVIEVGDIGYWFDLVAKDHVGSGIYYLQTNRVIQETRTTYLGFDSYSTFQQLPYYSIVPIVAIRVESEVKCQITLDGQHKVPINGWSQPIRVISDCKPKSELTIQPITMAPFKTVDPIIIGKQITQQFKLNNNKDAMLDYFIFEAGTGTAGDSYNISFKLTGIDAELFEIANYTLELVANQATTVNLTINATWNPTSQSAVVTCSKSGVLHWSVSTIGLQYWDQRGLLTSKYEIDANFNLVQLQFLLNPLISYLQYYQQYGTPTPQEQSALYTRQLLFGLVGDQRRALMALTEQGKPNTLTFKQIQQRNQLQVYCQDQYNQISEIKTFPFTNVTLSQQTHYLLTFEFQREISQVQINNILCTLQEQLKFNRHQVLNLACLQCNNNQLNYTKKTWVNVLNINETFETISTNYTSTGTNYKLYMYLNSYMSSSGKTVDINATLLQAFQELGDANSTFGKKASLFGGRVMNGTTDPELYYLYRYLTISNFTEVENISNMQVVANISKTNITMQFTGISDHVFFVGISNSNKSIDFSNPLQLRQGVSGNGIALEQYIITTTQSELSFQISDTKYFLQWSSAPLLGHCLTQQYQNTQLEVLEYIPPASSYGMIVAIQILAYVMIIII